MHYDAFLSSKNQSNPVEPRVKGSQSKALKHFPPEVNTSVCETTRPPKKNDTNLHQLFCRKIVQNAVLLDLLIIYLVVFDFS